MLHSRMRLEAGRCTLRPWEARDKADLVRHASNFNVWRNLAHVFPHPYTESDADVAAAGGIGALPLAGIYEKTADFGYWLGEPFWGRGIATAAVRAVVPYLFAVAPIERLQAGVFEWNPASMRVLEKAGFRKEGVLRRSVFKDGRLIDQALYALTRADRQGR